MPKFNAPAVCLLIVQCALVCRLSLSYFAFTSDDSDEIAIVLIITLALFLCFIEYGNVMQFIIAFRFDLPSCVMLLAAVFQLAQSQIFAAVILIELGCLNVLRYNYQSHPPHSVNV